MKKSILILIGLILIFGTCYSAKVGRSLSALPARSLVKNYDACYESHINIYRGFDFASYYLVKDGEEYWKLIEDKTLIGLNSAMGLKYSSGSFGQSFDIDPTITFRLDFMFPEPDLFGKKEYSIIREGELLAENSRDSSISEIDNQIYEVIQEKINVGDTIRMTPEISGETRYYGIPDDFIQSDWFWTGGYMDSPPIEFLSKSEFEEIEETLTEKFNQKYPCGLGTLYNDLCKENETVWEAERTDFSVGNRSYYEGELGYNAYIVPAYGNKQMGVQTFCNISVEIPDNPYGAYSYYFSHGASFSPDCIENEQGGIDCTIEEEGTNTIVYVTKLDCIVYVDKIIEENEAIEADWFMKHVNSKPGTQLIQAVPEGKKPPVPKFECTLLSDYNFYNVRGRIQADGTTNQNNIEVTQSGVIRCDASESYDPDGQIVNFVWDDMWGSWAYCQSPDYTFCHPTYLKILQLDSRTPIKLRVTDDDGLFEEITEYIDFSSESETNLLVEYDSETKMANILFECPDSGLIEGEQGTISIRDKITERSELEKQKINCNESTEIGPLEIKGAYEATVNFFETMLRSDAGRTGYWRVREVNEEKTLSAIFTID